MYERKTSGSPIQHLGHILLKYRYHWLIPTMLCTTAALFYAAHFYRPKWEAVQALMVRDEAVGNPARPGRFLDGEDRKTLQETVLQLVTSHAVVEAALWEVGPPAEYDEPAEWPTSSDIEQTQNRIEVRAPHGAEFGQTEVIHLAVSHCLRERAIALANTICSQVEIHLQQVRSDKAESLIKDLTRAEALAWNDLQAVIGELAGLERQVGGDLPELRILTEVGAGSSQLRQTQVQIGNELRQARAQREMNRQLEQLLVSAIDDQTHLVATPGSLLESQPAIRRLKDGLVDAQLRSADLMGKLSPTHPQIQAAQSVESGIRDQLNAELEVALRGVRTQLKTIDNRLFDLEDQQAGIEGRLVRLAGVRAHYENLVARSRRRDEILAAAERDLADARSSLAAATASSLISRVDVPRTGNYPSGPRRALIVAGGLAGGLIIGVGILFLTVPASETRPQIESTALVIPVPARRSTDRRCPSAGDERPTGYNLSIADAMARVRRQLPLYR